MSELLTSDQRIERLENLVSGLSKLLVELAIKNQHAHLEVLKSLQAVSNSDVAILKLIGQSQTFDRSEIKKLLSDEIARMEFNSDQMAAGLAKLIAELPALPSRSPAPAAPPAAG